MRKTKIVATIGPASGNAETIQALFDAGVNVFRLNFSHNDIDFHRQNAATIRSIESAGNRPVAILMDLQGPKFRIGLFEDGSITLIQGGKFVFDTENTFGNERRVYLPHPELFKSLSDGDDVFLDDGKIKLKVKSNNGEKIETEVITGGILMNKKGVNVPNAFINVSAITKKDMDDLQHVEEIGADYVAVSFVQTARDITAVRKLVPEHVKIVAKIEKPKAIENLDAIVNSADAVMIARGDLGVEMQIERVPVVQKQIVNICQRYQKPVIVATQMLETMIASPMPTRAEVSDIATAVYQGADAVMLSAETANGAYPIEAVNTMRNVIEATEQDNDVRTSVGATTEGRLIKAVIDDVSAVVSFTESGRTAINASNSRLANIVAMTPCMRTARRMCLVWGVYSVVVEDIYSFSQMLQIVDTKISGMFEKQKNIRVAIVAGMPFRESGTTNVLHIYDVKNNDA